ncbi:MAG: hypothetical protein F6K31_35225 [Symploca sp. SIO2G7]|nr:hypothetical protein [Symploca sp. SIO2G7]
MVRQKPTQAHITKLISKSQPEFLKARTKKQTEYYMGAKLIEVGVNPDKAIYRWTVTDKGTKEEWIYSAYWADSREKIETEEGNAG